MMKPFMFYAINKLEIENYLTIELNGDNPHLVKRSLLRCHIEKFVRNHIEDLDKRLLDDYINYICSHISNIRD